MDIKEFLAIVLLFLMIFIGIASITASYGADLDVVRDFDNTTIYHTIKSDSGSQKVSGIENNAKLVTTGTGSQKTIEIPFYKIIVVPKISIDDTVIPISNNNNTNQYNESNLINYQNNNTTNTNNVTTNINKENNTHTYISDNQNTIIMKKTGTNNPIGIILVIILFIILIQLYMKEDWKYDSNIWI